MGTTTAMNIGVDMLMTTKIATAYIPLSRKNVNKIEEKIRLALTLNTIRNHNRSICGIILSTVSTSFENRFIIRPSGVQSKNDIGNRIVRLSKLLCSSLAACTQPIPIAKLIAKNVMAKETKLKRKSFDV